MEKTKVNLIYAPQDKESTSPRFVSDQGELWMNPFYKEGWHNIGMSFYSCAGNYPNIEHKDMSVYIIEPRAVSDRDYGPKFLLNFKYIFTWCTKVFENTKLANKIIPLNHPSCFGFDKAGYEKRKESWASWTDRRKEIVFVSNNKSSNHYSELYSLRVTMADWMHENSPDYKVKWYSHIPINRPYYCGQIPDKNEILSKVRFSICTENCYDKDYSHNYFSEKMPDVMFSGAVPLYMGCYNIDDFGFSPTSYLDLRHWIKKEGQAKCDIDFPAIMREITAYDENRYNECLKGIDYNINEKNLFHIISEERVMAKMIETFAKE